MARLRSNQIQVLHHEGRMLFNHADRADVLHRFYSTLLGTTSPPAWGFDLRQVLPPVAGLSALEAPFSE